MAAKGRSERRKVVATAIGAAFIASVGFWVISKARVSLPRLEEINGELFCERGRMCIWHSAVVSGRCLSSSCPGEECFR